jgi:ribosomal protein S18 acetylase RimI-like enzyme
VASIFKLDWSPILLGDFADSDHSADLDAIVTIADRVHKDLHERRAVFAEKVRLYPQGCRKLCSAGQIVGYGIAHPWTRNSIPHLDAFLNSLPPKPDCLHIHDIVVLPNARGHGAAGQYMEYVKGLAKAQGRPLALVSVYGTDALWSRFGFRVIEQAELKCQLASYGESARYMICDP